ncbi:MAG: hypothetical protein DRJ52_10735 [Thermoprotei archaeon]|nr:MAG: hypothetical protein DRJ52_10735 [Thermoprotei archaeon]
MKRGAGRRRKRKRRVVMPLAISEIRDYKEAWRKALQKILADLEQEDDTPKYLIEAIKEVINQLREIEVQTRLI